MHFIHLPHSLRTTTVEHQLKQLVPSKATGPDGVPARVLQHCTATLAPSTFPPFHSLFRTGRAAIHVEVSQRSPSLQETVSWDDEALPVSVSSQQRVQARTKVIERIINSCITNYLEKEKLLSAHQFGFRPDLNNLETITRHRRDSSEFHLV